MGLELLILPTATSKCCKVSYPGSLRGSRRPRKRLCARKTVNNEVVYSRSPTVGNPITSILKSNAQGIPAPFGFNPVSNFTGFTVGVTTVFEVLSVWHCRLFPGVSGLGLTASALEKFIRRAKGAL